MPKRKSVTDVPLPAADEEFWLRTEAYMPRTKQGVFVRLDADVLVWLRSRGKGYQTRMNAMLRVLMESDKPMVRVPSASADSAITLPILLDAGAAAPVIEISRPTRRKRAPVAERCTDI